jgi:hypothetical protein
MRHLRNLQRGKQQGKETKKRKDSGMVGNGEKKTKRGRERGGESVVRKGG